MIGTESTISGDLPVSETRSIEPNNTSVANARVVSLAGLTDYTDALELQYAAQRAVGQALIGNTLYLLEHPPVVTIGRGAGRGDKDLLVSRSSLTVRGIEVIDADRGGDTTYHGPGQLVGYSIVDLHGFGKDLHCYLRALEQIIICSLADFHIEAHAVTGLTGVWVGNSKIAAIGLKVSRWVSMHGFSLNINADIGVMRNDIVPCGIRDKGVVSMQELEVLASRQAVEFSIARYWSRHFGGEAIVRIVPSDVKEEYKKLLVAN